MRGDELEEFSWIEDAGGIEGLLEAEVNCAAHLARRFGPPAFFGQTDAMLARDHSAPGQDLGKQFIERLLDPGAHRGISVIGRHEVDVEIAVASVTKGGDGEAMPRLQIGRELDQLDEAPTGHDNVLVQFRQASGPERIAELASQGPQFFRALLSRGDGERIGIFAFE